jgi:hypothetical protein
MRRPSPASSTPPMRSSPNAVTAVIEGLAFAIDNLTRMNAAVS